jgi:hypothetical protein
MLQLVKVASPLFGDRAGVIEVGLVEFLDIRGIAAKQI